jgi:hypothetical protein
MAAYRTAVSLALRVQLWRKATVPDQAAMAPLDWSVVIRLTAGGPIFQLFGSSAFRGAWGSQGLLSAPVV